MNALVGLSVTGSVLGAFVVLFFLVWAGGAIEKKITGDPYAGFLGGLCGTIVWLALLLGILAAMYPEAV